VAISSSRQDGANQIVLGQGTMGKVLALAERTGSEALIVASTVANIVSFPLKVRSWAWPRCDTGGGE
jgi:hypothetical protein